MRSQLLGIPSFLICMWVFYWSLPLAVAFGYVKSFSFGVGRNDMYEWSVFLMKFFRVKVLKYGDKTLYKGGRVLYLCNHRSWGDFFIDSYVVEGRANFLARWMVFFAFPVVMLSCHVINCIVFFKRGSIADKDAFNKWLDYKNQISPLCGYLVYPEGHRNIKPGSLTLKRGLLHYAYSRKLACQVIMVTDKEDVLSEKTCHVNFGRTVVCGFGDVIDTKVFPDFETFFTAVKKQWDVTWEEVYGADPQTLPPYQPQPDLYPFTTKAQVLQALVSGGGIIVMLLILLGGAKLGLTALAMTGSYQQVVAALLVVWTAASFVQTTIPYRHCPACYTTTTTGDFKKPAGESLKPVVSATSNGDHS